MTAGKTTCFLVALHLGISFVTAKPLPPNYQYGQSAESFDELVWKKLGLRMVAVDRESVSKVNSRLNGGLKVVEVRPQSPAAAADFRKGDMLIGLYQWETLNLANVKYVLIQPDFVNFDPLLFFIIRNGQVQRGFFGPIR